MMVCLLLRYDQSLRRRGQFLNDRAWDALVDDHFAAGVADGVDEARRPGVLKEHQRRRRVVLERRGELMRVVLIEHRGDIRNERIPLSKEVRSQIAELEHRHVALFALYREEEVDNAHSAVFDEVSQR